MNRRLLTILLCAFVAAAACAYVVYRVVGTRSTQPSNATRVVAAAANIKIGNILTADNLTTTQITGALPQGAIQDPKLAIGRGVLSDIYQGEPILESRLASAGAGGGMAATIPSGMRACAVKVDEVVGVAGFVTPGMRVDVIISGTPPGAANTNDGPKVKTLLQNIQVLSAGTDIQKDAEGKPQQVQVVTLLVAPDQAEVLSLASNQTHIQLVLRNPLDTQFAQVPGSAMVNLFGGATVVHATTRPAVSKKIAPQVYSVEVFNGSKRTEQNFAAPEEKQ